MRGIRTTRAPSGKSKHDLLIRWLLAVAAILLISSTGFWFLLNRSDKPPSTVVQTTAEKPISASPSYEAATEASVTVTFASASVGDEIPFGHYEQDGDAANGAEELRWTVLAKEENRLLLISNSVVDFQPYHCEYAPVTWEFCSLRSWLNDAFYFQSFSPEEQSQILLSSVPASSNPDYNTDSGNATQDRIFLLSAEEACHYFSSDAERETGCHWWLRTPGIENQIASYVSGSGSISSVGDVVINIENGVRPALWVGTDVLAVPEGSDKTEALYEMLEAKEELPDSALTVQSSNSTLLAEPDPIPAMILAADVGDEVLFGRYEQDNDLLNGKEPIEWIVLEKESDRLLVVSKYALDCSSFSSSLEFNWESSELRSWLNREFISSAFSDVEWQYIAQSSVSYMPDYANAKTLDRIFLLNLTQAENLFPNNAARKCVATAYAFDRFPSATWGKGVFWWLCTQGNAKNNAAIVWADGNPNPNGQRGYRVFYVRPAMWLQPDIDPEATVETSVKPPLPEDIRSASVGDTIFFGCYEQDNDLLNGKEAIEWTVLEKEQDKMLVISSYLLESLPFHDDHAEINSGTRTSTKNFWGNNSLYTWLNREFSSNAFNSSEWDRILLTTIDIAYDIAAKDLHSSTSRVFLLSMEEANEYFHDDEARLAVFTAYAAAQAGQEAESSGSWWLRSRSQTAGYSFEASVRADGSIAAKARDKFSLHKGIRPVLWLDLSD